MAKKPSYKDLEQKIKEFEQEVLSLKEYKNKAEKLQDKESRYQAVLENQTEMICCFQPDGTITFVNEAYCRFFNKDRKELIGHKFLSLIPEDDREKVFESISNLNPNKPIITHEHRVFAPNGEFFWHKWTNRAIFDDQNKMMEYQAVGWDITERRIAEENQQKAHKALKLGFERRSQTLYDTLKKMEQKEKDLVKHKSDLQKLNKEMIETNRALSVLARNIDKNKEIFEEKIYETITVKILPIIKDLKRNSRLKQYMADLDVLENNLNSLFTASNHLEIIHSLTYQEMRVAALIKRGLTSEKISKMLYISEHTVKTHRKKIRKKLKIKNSNINLTSYLKSNMPSVSI